jgi:ABC-type amino acid transport substrate-binding protein
MLSRRAIIGATLALVGSRAWAAPSPAPLAPDMRRIRERGRLIVALGAGALPPFVTAAGEGAPHGFDVELAQGMAQALGVALDFDRSAQSGDDVIDRVASGAVDLGLSRLIVTLSRAERVRFSQPYLVLHRALLFNRPRLAQIAAGREPLDVLRNGDGPLAIVAGSGAGDAAHRLLPRAELKEFPRWDPELVAAVLDGSVLAGWGDEIEARRTLTQQPEAPLRLRATTLPTTSERVAVALPWESRQLLAWVDLYLGTALTPVTPDELLARETPGDAPGTRP